MKRLVADLHIHTMLSPCALEEMTPPAIVHAAQEAGLAMIAICDHNSAANTAAVLEAAGDAVAVLPGIEIMTIEDVHVTGLFPDADAAMGVSDAVRRSLPEHGGAAKPFGEQRICDAQGRTVGRESKMLAASTPFSLAETIALIRNAGGLAVAAHADRPSFSVTSQLGVFPEDVRFDAIEISAAGVADGRAEQFVSLGLPLVSSSDSHSLSEIGGGRTVFCMAQATFDELELALAGRDGRSCRLA